MLKEKKSKIRLFQITFVFITVLMMVFNTGCSEDPLSTKPLSSDEQLMKSIQDASDKLTVTEENLPSSTRAILNQDYSESYVEQVKLAPKLGYEIDLRMEAGVYVGELVTKYFGVDGREIRVVAKAKDKHRVEGDRNEKERNKCFALVLPVVFTMPDGSEITVAERDEWNTIRSWYEANPDSRERPTLNYPVSVIFRDGTTLTVESAEEMRDVYANCDDGRKKDRRDEKCFKFVLPITYLMADGTEITINELADWGLLKSWHEANPDLKERPALKFPVDVTFRDGTTKTVNNEEEMKRIIALCNRDKRDDGKNDEKCFKFVLPITYTMPDASTITIDTLEDWGLLKSWYSDNPGSKEKPVLKFPVDITLKDGSIVTITNAEEFQRVLAGCKDRKDDGRRKDNP